MSPSLPITPVLPALREVLAAGNTAVLQAPPGAGKTTMVPLALAGEPWLAGRKLVMLEPRRLAARAAARRMAALLGEPVGQTVGFRIRMETQVSARTRIEVVTEGVLTRMLQEDPSLEGAGLLVFDEYHERSLPADTGLALALETQAVLRPDLRLLVMSATLEGARVAGLLGGAPVVRSEGEAFPVTTLHRPPRAGQRIEDAAAAVVREALAAGPGDILVFLPGAGEIRRVQERLEQAGLDPAVSLHSLHGAMPIEAQDLAILPGDRGRRKVVLATAIAETSLTIEGVRVVVDAGLARVPRFSPRTGMTRLETVRVSRASADQRRGRAGRLGPGTCYRLWAAHDEIGMVAHATPEILEADLAPLALDLAVAGVRDPATLRWLDPPPAAAFAQARELLGWLGALDRDGRLTAHGRAMAGLGMHPRLAHMALVARQRGEGALAAQLAALLGDRDPARGVGGAPDADLRLRVEALAHPGRGTAIPGIELDPGGARRVRMEAAEWARRLGAGAGAVDPSGTGALLALAYPDRIAQRRSGQAGRFVLRNGRGAALPPGQSLEREDWLVVAALDDAGSEGRIQLAAPLSLEEVTQAGAGQAEEIEELRWDPAAGVVVARRLRRLGALVLAEATVHDPDPDARRRAVLLGIAGEGIAALPWSPASRRLRERLAFLHHWDPAAWPDVSDQALSTTLADWLGPSLAEVRRRSDLARLDLGACLAGRLDWSQRSQLEALAPDRIEVPSGSRIAVDYSDPSRPVLAVRLQEVFGWTTTPAIGGGKVPLTLHLLSPAYRPVQVTQDLAGFWRGAYFEVRKDLRGRYPKHAWPEDPLAAAPVRGPRRRG